MVVRTRLRAFLFPLTLYCVSAGVGTFFVWHAVHGDRGLKVKIERKGEIAALRKELAELKAERERWIKRVALISGGEIDRDILDEEARTLLGRVSAQDLVIMLPKGAGRFN